MIQVVSRDGSYNMINVVILAKCPYQKSAEPWHLPAASSQIHKVKVTSVISAYLVNEGDGVRGRLDILGAIQREVDHRRGEDCYFIYTKMLLS